MSFATVDKSSKKFTLHGIDQPAGDIIRVQSGFICVKVPGYDYYLGESQFSYHPAEYQMWQVSEVRATSEPNVLEVTVDKLINFDVRTKPSDYGAGIHRLEDY